VQPGTVQPGTVQTGTVQTGTVQTGTVHRLLATAVGRLTAAPHSS
jgi:hypothetical protein